MFYELQIAVGGGEGEGREGDRGRETQNSSRNWNIKHDDNDCKYCKIPITATVLCSVVSTCYSEMFLDIFIVYLHDKWTS